MIVFDGFLKVYGITKTEEDDEENNEKLLPKVKCGEVLSYKKLQLPKNSQTSSKIYGSCFGKEKLEELGIGRPSTYAPTIQTIQNRGYVDKEILPQEREIETFFGKIWTEKEVLTEKFGEIKINSFLQILAKW